MSMDGSTDCGNGVHRLQSPFTSPFSSDSFHAPRQISSEGYKRPGFPPSHPVNPNSSVYSQFPPFRPSSQQPCLPNLSPRLSSSSGTLPQQSAFPHDGLPPLSPTDISMSSLPPRRGHRRSNSDSIPLGFNAMIQLSPQLLPIGSVSHRGSEDAGVDKLNQRESELKRDVNGNVLGAMNEKKSDGEVLDAMIDEIMNMDNLDSFTSSGGSGTRLNNGGESSDNEVESRIKGIKRAACGISTPRHCRSVSMDSYMNSLILEDDSLKVSPMETQEGQQSLGDFIDVSNKKLNMAFRNGDFTSEEWKKIISNDKLHEIAYSDPKRVKRILANRLSAARSKERKTRYTIELEHKVLTLQSEATNLSAQVTVLQREATSLTSENKELKFRLQAIEQQSKLKDALNDTLTAEVERLKVTVAELGGEARGTRSMAPVSLQRLFQLQLQQQQHMNTHQQQQHKQHEQLDGYQPQQQNGNAANHRDSK